jgi:hypothetical protein
LKITSRELRGDTPAHRVFVAYSRLDLAKVRPIVDKLKAAGINVFIDVESLQVGDLWVDRLKQLIEQADTILFVVSQNGLASQWVRQEAMFAAEQDKRILPVVIGDADISRSPIELAQYHWLTLRDVNDAAAFDALLRAIRAGAKYGAGAKSDNIFISYRRQGTEHVAGRIFDHLERDFGTKKVFFDVESTPIGVDFRTHIRQSILQSTAVVLVIGQEWNELFFRRLWPIGRLVRAEDYVRTEIELAIEHSVRIFPVLVDGASMPKGRELPSTIRDVSYLNAAMIRSGRDFRGDIARVSDEIRNPLARAA